MSVVDVLVGSDMLCIDLVIEMYSTHTHVVDSVVCEVIVIDVNLRFLRNARLIEYSIGIDGDALVTRDSHVI